MLLVQNGTRKGVTTFFYVDPSQGAPKGIAYLPETGTFVRFHRISREIPYVSAEDKGLLERIDKSNQPVLIASPRGFLYEDAGAIIDSIPKKLLPVLKEAMENIGYPTDFVERAARELTTREQTDAYSRSLAQRRAVL